MAPKNGRRTALAAMLVLALLGLLYIIANRGNGLDWLTGALSLQGGDRPVRFSPTGAAVPYNTDSVPSFYPLTNGSFYFCTKDGVQFIDEKGQSKWGDVFTMAAPVLIGEGDYAAAAEPKGGTVHVYGPSGKLYAIDAKGLILNFNINKNGYASITVKIDQYYATQVFNDKGALLLTFKHEEANIFPMCADISNDNRIAAVGLLDISGIKMMTHVMTAFLNKEEFGNYIDGIFGSVPIENEMATRLLFFKDNALMAFGDASITTIALNAENAAQSVSAQTLTNEVQFIEAFGDNGFVAAFGGAMTGLESAGDGHLIFYNANAEPLGDYTIGKKITSLNCTGQTAIVGANRTFYAFNAKGKLLWQYNATQDLKALLPLSGSDTVLAVSATEAAVMKRSN